MKLTLTMTFPFKDSGEGKYERLSLAGVLYNVSENDDEKEYYRRLKTMLLNNVMMQDIS